MSAPRPGKPWFWCSMVDGRRNGFLCCAIIQAAHVAEASERIAALCKRTIIEAGSDPADVQASIGHLPDDRVPSAQYLDRPLAAADAMAAKRESDALAGNQSPTIN